MVRNINGKGAVGVAIGFYALNGMVSLPLEPCNYNLIFDDGEHLKRIKVISCSYKTPHGVYSASIRMMGGNMPHQTIKKFDESSCDVVFIVTDELDMYAIPSCEIKSVRQISLNVYGKYKVILGDVG
jgi:hypothetical protein